MRGVMRSLLAFSLLCAACGPYPKQLEFTPKASLPPPVTTVKPPPGPFNGEVELTFTTDRPATVYVSTDGSDPRSTSKNRLQGDSPFKVKLNKTATVSYFASVDGKDEDLHTETWTRAGGPVGTISGVVVVGEFAVGKDVGVLRNAEALSLKKPAMAGEIPFEFKNVMTGTHRLTALADRNGDGQLIPFIDFQSATETVTLDLADPFKASAENVRLYLGTSPPELCTMKGTITLPRPPAGQILSVNVLGADAFSAISDPMALLNQLQNGYRVGTAAGQTDYPYVVTDLKPGTYMAVPSLLGLGAGGLATTFIFNPLGAVNCKAGETATADVTFGPAGLNGAATLNPPLAPDAGFTIGVVASRNSSIQTGIQAVLMPAPFIRDPQTGELRGGFAAQALRANTSFPTRVFVANGPTANPVTDALLWVVNPFAPQPPHTTVQTGTGDATVDITVP